MEVGSSCCSIYINYHHPRPQHSRTLKLMTGLETPTQCTIRRFFDRGSLYALLHIGCCSSRVCACGQYFHILDSALTSYAACCKKGKT